MKLKSWNEASRKLKSRKYKISLMKLRVAFFLVFILLLIGKTNSQVLPNFNPEKAALTKNYIRSGFIDFAQVTSAPFSWQQKDWMLFGGVSVGTVLLFTSDLKISTWFYKHRTSSSSKIVDSFIEPWGGDIQKNYTIYSIIGCYAIGLAIKDEQLKKVAMLSTKAIIVSGVLNGLSKAAFGRKRPYQTQLNSAHIWEGPNLKGYYSFPSGHTMSVWSVASVFAYEYKNKPWVPITAYSLATLVGVSRIHDNDHWASDVFLGAAFGWTIGHFIAKQNNWGLSISSVNGKSTAGLAYTF